MGEAEYKKDCVQRIGVVLKIWGVNFPHLILYGIHTFSLSFIYRTLQIISLIKLKKHRK